SDRDLVVGILREQHLCGRLDSDELEQRLERCLAAKSLAELQTITADLPNPDARPWAPPGSPVAHPGGQNVRRVLRNLASLIAILLLAIWALTSDGYFWPAWGWFGLCVPVGIDASLRWAARRRPAGAQRRALVLWTLFAFLEGAFVAIWVLTAMSGSATYFWPVWPLLGFVATAGTYSALTLGTSGRQVHGGRR
ncbi:MAG TPA: DUF1707 domain-containing protein, partial [Chloroflexota bacterium]